LCYDDNKTTHLSDTIIYFKVWKSAVFKYFGLRSKPRQAGCTNEKIKFTTVIE